jgi:tetratricopeptide (TPR) repeat protein
MKYSLVSCQLSKGAVCLQGQGGAAAVFSEKALGPEHPDVATTLNDMANLLKSQGKYEEALPLYQRALAIYQKSLGPEHPWMATTLNNMAILHYSQGKYEEALPLYQRALAIYQKSLGPEHPSMATVQNNIAILLEARQVRGTFCHFNIPESSRQQPFSWPVIWSHVWLHFYVPTHWKVCAGMKQALSLALIGYGVPVGELKHVREAAAAVRACLSHQRKGRWGSEFAFRGHTQRHGSSKVNAGM